MRYRPLIACLLGISSFVILFTLAPKRATTSPATSHIAATIFPLYDIVRNVAPDNVNVTQILPAGANPHTFEPSPALVESLAGVDALFAIGHGADDWTDLLSDKTPTLVDNGISLRTTTDHEDLHIQHAHEGGDPHYWLTIPNAKQIANNVAAELIQKYPDQKDTVHARLAAYIAQLDAADAQIRATLTDMQNRNVVTMHDAWYYFAEEYGFAIAGTFEPSAGREPTPQYLAALQETITRLGVRTLYIEPAAAAGPALRAFAADNDLTLQEVDAEGLLSPASYIELMLSNAQAFRQNH